VITRASVGASSGPVLDVLAEAGLDRAYQGHHPLQRAPDSAVAVRPASIAVANFWFCTMISSSAFVSAYRYRVPICDIRLLGCHPSYAVQGEQFPRGGPDPLQFVLFDRSRRPVGAPGPVMVTLP
jgi:hypothetical protein